MKVIEHGCHQPSLAAAENETDVVQILGVCAQERLYVRENWTRIISGGQFDNIVNNPTDREIDLPSVVRARYLRLIPLRSDRSSTYGVSTFDITE